MAKKPVTQEEVNQALRTASSMLYTLHQQQLRAVDDKFCEIDGGDHASQALILFSRASTELGILARLHRQQKEVAGSLHSLKLWNS